MNSAVFESFVGLNFQLTRDPVFSLFIHDSHGLTESFFMIMFSG